MGFLIYMTKHEKAKLFFRGNTLNILTMASIVCKAAAERIAKEKNIPEHEAMDCVIEGVKKSQELIK